MAILGHHSNICPSVWAEGSALGPFDCVQHSVLLSKLKSMNIDDDVISWAKSYLTNRQQRVYANNTYSTYQTLTQGVPQGSVLGPLLNIIYANDISKVVKSCNIALYADDAVLLCVRQ